MLAKRNIFVNNSIRYVYSSIEENVIFHTEFIGGKVNNKLSYIGDSQHQHGSLSDDGFYFKDIRNGRFTYNKGSYVLNNKWK